MKKLSICIPTFNRGDFLKRLLVDILENERSHEVEIVISDNASTDNTDEVVEFFKDKFSKLIYSKFDVNKGPDANFLQCVSLATSEYCWLMGSDDSISSGAIKQVLKNIENSEPSVVLINITECDYHLNKMRVHHWINEEEKTLFNTKIENDLVEMFNAANPLWGLFFGYISSVVVKRSDWNSVSYNEKFNGTLFSFTSIVMQLIVRGCTLKSIREPVVLNRGYNDSMVAELSGNQFARLVLDLDMYIVFSNMIPSLKVREAYTNLARRNFGFYYILKIILNSKKEEWVETREKFLSIGVSSNLLKIVEFLNLFKYAFKMMLIFRRKYLPRRRIF